MTTEVMRQGEELVVRLGLQPVGRQPAPGVPGNYVGGTFKQYLLELEMRTAIARAVGKASSSDAADSLRAAIDKIAAFVEGARPPGSSQPGRIERSIGSWLSDTWDKIVDAVKDAVDAVGDWASDAFDDTCSVVGTVAGLTAGAVAALSGLGAAGSFGIGGAVRETAESLCSGS